MVSAAHRARRVAAALALALVACEGDCELRRPRLDLLDFDDFDGDSEQEPWRDAWRDVYDGPIDGTLTTLRIGSALGSQDNFVNRGDVIVTFDAAPGSMRVAFRRFTFAPGEESAAEIFDNLEPWMFISDGDPKKPADMDPATDCSTAMRDGCSILVYYYGQAQLQRAGADIHVSLPPEFRGQLVIEISDSIIEDAYPNRGDVCIADLPASADISLASGRAHVTLARNVSPAPACAPDDVSACAWFDDPATESSDAWAPECPCVADEIPFGSLAVHGTAADVVIDVPQSLWLALAAENLAPRPPFGQHCTTTVAGLENVIEGEPDPDAPNARHLIANIPSEVAVGGYDIAVVADACEVVPIVETPDDWDGDDKTPAGELRGFIDLCVDCLPHDCAAFVQ